MKELGMQSNKLLKRACQYVLFIAALPMILLSLRRLGTFGDQAYYFFATSLALVPGKIGGFLRTAFYRGTAEDIHWDVNIGFGTFFTKRTVRIGHNVGIGAYCMIGSAVIGPHCRIASRVSIPSGKHQHASPDNADPSSADSLFSQIHIGQQTWVGEGAVILADVGAGCIVGAGSVVVHPVLEGCTVAGNPAKIIRSKPCTSTN